MILTKRQIDAMVNTIPNTFDNILHESSILVDKSKFDISTIDDHGDIITIDTISKCNLHCSFCRGSISNIGELSKLQTMTQTAFEIFVKRATDYGIKHIEMTPAIGEPFIDKGIIDKLKHLEENDKIESYIITTNLTMWKDVHFEFIKTCNKIVFNISLYGYDEESYSKSTNRKNKFQTFYANFTRLADIVHEYDNVYMIIFMRCGLPFNHRFPRTPIFYDVFNLANLKNCWLNNGDIENINRAANLEGFEKKSRQRSGICPNGPGIGGGVIANGDFLFCPFNDINRVGVVGNLYTQSLEEIYSGDKWQEILNNHMNNTYIGICKNCDETW